MKGSKVKIARAVRLDEAAVDEESGATVYPLYFVSAWVLLKGWGDYGVDEEEILGWVASSLGADADIYSDFDSTEVSSFPGPLALNPVPSDAGASIDCLPERTAPRVYTIKYAVSGPSRAAVITYTNKNDDTSQATNASLPWTYTFKSEYAIPDSLYLSAQNASGGTIYCSIYIDGKRIKKNASSGQYAICQATLD